MQLNELIRYIERDGILLIRDYCGENADHNNIYKEIQKLNSEELDKVEGIGEARATAIRTGLKRIKEQINLKKEI